MKKEDVKRFFSPGAILRKLSATAVRFPLPVAIIAALAVLLFISIHNHDVMDYRLWISLPMALLASVAVTVSLEDGLERRRRRQRIFTTLAVTIVAVLLCGLYALILPGESHAVDDAQAVEIAVMMGTVFFAIFFVSFLGRERRGEGDAPWWNFGVRTIWRLMLGAIFSGILFGGFFLALLALEELFGVDIPGEAIGDLAVVCFVVFAPLYVLAGVPQGEAKHDTELHPEPVLKVLALYILAPVLAVYTLILYGYLLKIVVMWELPNGWVSWLVTVLAMGGLVVTLLLYPLRMRGDNKVVDFLSRWMGVIFLPLLVLMTVGIARRVSDYGFTVNRAYILLLNLWFYGVYIYLFAVRGRRVKWILISAVAVGVLSSVGPWSIARVVVPRPSDETAGVLTTVDMDYEWFRSDSTAVSNMPYILEGRSYGRFARIAWTYYDAERGEYDELTDMKLSEQEDDLVVGLPKEGREFRIPFRRAAEEKVISGDGYMFMVGICEGRLRNTRQPSRDPPRRVSVLRLIYFRLSVC